MLSHEQIWSAIDALAARYGLSPSALARQAGLDPTTFNPSKRIAGDGRPRWPSTESLSKILDATGEPLEAFVAELLAGGTNRPKGEPDARLASLVPLDPAAARARFKSRDLPLGERLSQLPFTDPKTGDLFALEVSGDQMLPLYRNGDILIVAPGSSVRQGDRVVVRTLDERLTILMLHRQTAETTEFHSLTRTQATHILDRSEIDWIAASSGSANRERRLGLFRKLRPVLIPALVLVTGAALLAWLLLADPPAPPSVRKMAAAESRQDPASPTPSAAQKAPPEKTKTTDPEPPLPSEIRDVSPEGISPPEITGKLTHVQPSQRLLNLINPPVEPVPEGEFEMRRPKVIDAGTLENDDLRVKVAHIDALKPDETCVSRLGGSWPCGARARTALRGLIRMFTVVCHKTEDLGPRQIAATCTRRKTDIGAWLVRYGWADPTETAPENYAALAEEAKKRKRGKWQSEWLKELPEPATDLSTQELPSGQTGDFPEDGNNILVTPQDLPQPDPEFREALPPNG